MCVPSCLSCVRFFATSWTVAHQAPLSMGFSRQEYWSGLPCPPPGDLPKPGIKPASLTSPALASGFFTTGATWEAHLSKCTSYSFMKKNNLFLRILESGLIPWLILANRIWWKVHQVTSKKPCYFHLVSWNTHSDWHQLLCKKSD